MKDKKIAFPLDKAASMAALLTTAMMKNIPNLLDGKYLSGGIPEPRIEGEDGQIFDCLYQYHAYLWGKHGKEKADEMVNDFKKRAKEAFERLFNNTATP